MKKEQETVHTSALVPLMTELKADGWMGFNSERNGFSPSSRATDLEVIAFKIWRVPEIDLANPHRTSTGDIIHNSSRKLQDICAVG